MPGDATARSAAFAPCLWGSLQHQAGHILVQSTGLDEETLRFLCSAMPSKEKEFVYVRAQISFI